MRTALRSSLAVAFLLLASACTSRGAPGDGGTADLGGGDGGAADLGGADADAGPTPDVFQVEFTTTKGVFVVEVHQSWSPNGATRFRGLVESGFYDQCRFFRVVPGFVVQFGINGTPAINSMWSSRTIPDDPVLQSNLTGTVAFAKTGAPNSRTTQLFVSYADNAFLDAMGFAPIGRIVSGMDVVTMINAEYAEMPDQTLIASMGNAYLDASFPRLDAITSARVLP